MATVIRAAPAAGDWTETPLATSLSPPEPEGLSDQNNSYTSKVNDRPLTGPQHFRQLAIKLGGPAFRRIRTKKNSRPLVDRILVREQHLLAFANIAT